MHVLWVRCGSNNWAVLTSSARMFWNVKRSLGEASQSLGTSYERKCERGNKECNTSIRPLICCRNASSHMWALRKVTLQVLYCFLLPSKFSHRSYNPTNMPTSTEYSLKNINNALTLILAPHAWPKNTIFFCSAYGTMLKTSVTKIRHFCHWIRLTLLTGFPECWRQLAKPFLGSSRKPRARQHIAPYADWLSEENSCFYFPLLVRSQITTFFTLFLYVISSKSHQSFRSCA